MPKISLKALIHIPLNMPEKPLDLDKEIARLRSYAMELARLTIDDILPNAKFDEYDHLSFMETSFVVKQVDHLKSVLILVKSEQYQDALGISRVMAEGLALLYWANEEPKERPLNWRAYVWVDQFKRLYGKPAYAEHKAEIELALDKYCRQYLNDASKGKVQKDIVPDDYLVGWRREDDAVKNKLTPKKVKGVFKDAGLEKIHEALYSPASGWLHWDSISMAESIQRNPDGSIEYGARDLKYIGAQAIATGFHALFGTVTLLNENFKLGLNARLKELFDGYIAKKELTA